MTDFPPPRTFKVLRDTDVSGISGAGHVADGVTFGDGTTVLRWRTEHRSTAVYSTWDDMVEIHGHSGATRFEFNTAPEFDQWQTEALERGIEKAVGPDWRDKVILLPPGSKVHPLTVVREEPDEHRHDGEQAWAAADAMKDDPAWEHRVMIKPGSMDILRTADFKFAVLKIVNDELKRSARTRGGMTR